VSGEGTKFAVFVMDRCIGCIAVNLEAGVVLAALSCEHGANADEIAPI